MASLLEDPSVQAFVGTADYERHKARRFPSADDPVIAQNDAFSLHAPQTHAALRHAYEASSGFYYAGQPAFEDLLGRIAEWAPRL